jgi:hypothetical protein
MSRSYRKKPIRSITTAQSEKKDKKMWHRKLRRKCRSEIENGAEVLPHFREISNVWDFQKDGKCYDPDWMLAERKRMSK